jgi:signal transduction histidine kinase
MLPNSINFIRNINIPHVTEVLGDFHRVAQIVSNIVANAIKFTPSGEIEFSMREGEIQGRKKEILFSVRDTGIGMTEETISRLFRPFGQVRTP